MLLLCLSLSLFCVCSSYKVVRICYGNQHEVDLGIYSKNSGASVFFTPTNGGVKRLLVVNGKSVDPRFKTNSYGRLVMSGLTEQDNGLISVTFQSGSEPKRISTLVILDCAETQSMTYGNVFSLRIPGSAEYLEFTPSKNLKQVKVAWNRSDPNAGRGTVTRSYWEISSVTQEDSGYYKFRAKSNILMSWKKLLVIENVEMYDRHEGEAFLIEYPTGRWNVTFEPLQMAGPHAEMEKLTRLDTRGFKDRMVFSPHGILIDPVHVEDSGIFKFRDVNGNVILRAELDVTMSGIPMWIYTFAICGVIFGVICCWCCIRECCCKKSSTKRNNPAPQPAAASGQDEPQPVRPRHSTTSPAQGYSHQPSNPRVYRDPASTSAAPTVAASGGLLSNTSDFISSNSDPQYELKGYFSSTSPLSSDTTITDVYNSDKLNFL